jgi:lipopolysaccharide transport system ATP-binding protein
VVGIIGVNGAGKSTLLKVLSRITPPTRGSVRIWGRVSSLLEVGTGFHQELTGRDNIYLNGTVLGMKKREVDAKFDEIVDFSGVEKFLDTPVKRYSSGMRVRLAFAVAAFLEPEILIIDEVLAVGDAAFQKKCMSKMQDVGEHGRTVLFVSHNMPAVTRLCQRCILLNGGKLVEDGTSEDVVAAYLNSGQGISAEQTWDDPATAPGDEVVRLRGIRVKTEDGVVRESLDIRKPIGLEMDFEVFEGGHQLLPYYDLHNDEGTRVFSAIDLDREWDGVPRKPGRYVSTAWIPGNLLNEGMIYVRSTIRTSNRKVRRVSIRDAVAFHVTDTGEPGASRGSFPGRLPGAVRPFLNWETTFTAR